MNTINDIVEYLKQTNIKYPNLKDNNSKIFILETIYKDLDLICKNINYPKNPSKKIKNILNEIEPIDSMYHGSYIYLQKENFLLENVTKLEIKKLYPQNLVYIYHNLSQYDDLKFYSYLVENRNKIKNKLYYDENVLFDMIINYMYGFLSRNKKNKLLSYVTEFISILMKKIIENDKCNDIFYIDTDQIFYFSDKYSDKIIDNILNDIYDYDKKIIKNIFFIQKKRYFIFDPNTTKIRGFSIPTRIRNKKIYNLAYIMSNSSSSYNRFFNPIKNNKENYKKYLNKAENILNRESKLKKILKNNS